MKPLHPSGLNSSVYSSYTLAGTEFTTIQHTLTIKRETFPRDYKIPRTNRIFLRTASATAMKTVWSARAEIWEFHLARPKHHSAWLLSLRPNVLPVPDQVWFLSVLARMKPDQFTVLTIVSFKRFFQCRNVNNTWIIQRRSWNTWLWYCTVWQMVYRPTCRIPNTWRVNVNYLSEEKTAKIPITLLGSIPELEWSQFPNLKHYITFQFTASRQASVCLLQHAPLKPKQKCWGRNRKDPVSSGFWLEISIHFFSLPCRPHASSVLHSIWSTPVITICWKATCRLLSLPPWASCSETGCSQNVTLSHPQKAGGKIRLPCGTF